MPNNQIQVNNKGLLLDPRKLALMAKPFLAKKCQHEGWVKNATSLNKEEINERSLVGELVKDGEKWLSPGIYIDCTIDGNRNYATDFIQRYLYGKMVT